MPTAAVSTGTPELSVGGAASPVAAAHVDELTSLVADGRSVTVDAGHLVHAHQPAAFLRELLRFLDS
jgi:pimeloyl-ACP methyl ester carboxylesterase